MSNIAQHGMRSVPDQTIARINGTAAPFVRIRLGLGRIPWSTASWLFSRWA
jgi:hypothetical protein